MFATFIYFAVILSVLVLIHELGHFLVAKKFGIKVEEFGFGFPPRIWGIKKGETLYSINLLPVGGFVKLFGEDSAGGGKMGSKEVTGLNETDVKRAFFARPLWQRIMVVTAGVIMNFILAIVIISYLFSSQGVPLPTGKVTVTDITTNSPASIAGLKKGDLVLELNGQKVTDVPTFQKTTKKFVGKEISLLVVRDNQTFTTKLTPRVNPPKGEGAMGVVINDIEVKKYVWYKAPIFGTIEAGKFSWLILSGLGGTVRDIFTGGFKAESVAGPIGVAQLTGEAVRAGWFAVLWFVALLSLNLAVLNIMPIPALDGGRFFFMLIELFTGRKVSPKYEGYAHAAGLVVLLSLMALITVLDISRLVQGKSILP